MSDFSNTEPNPNDTNLLEFDPGPEQAAKAGNRDFSVKTDWYPLRVTKVEKTNSKAGNPMLVIELTDTAGATKTKFPYRLYQPITSKSQGRVSELLAVMGATKKDNGGYVLDAAQVIGKEVEAYLEPDTYEGTTRSRPTKIRKVEASKEF